MDEETKAIMQAILAILVENRDDVAQQSKKNEVLLADNGVSVKDIVKITGKTQAAVVKAIQRSKGSKK